MWKCHNFTTFQILREINFGDSKCAKSAIWTHLQALNLDFYELLYFLKAEILAKFRGPKMAKTGDLELLDYPKLISR